MKKIIIGLWIAVSVILLGGNVYYTYLASSEVGRVYHLAYANERDGIMTSEELATVKHFVKRQRTVGNMMYPVRSYERLRRKRESLQRIRKEAIDREMRGAYCALEVTK